MSNYLLHGNLRAKEGHGDQLADILVKASALVQTAKGCRLYVLSRDPDSADTIWITEIWDSKEDHDGSLLVPGVRELIGQAMPILDGKPERGQELQLLGGFIPS